MENSKNFDLMKNKPVFDRDTLNYIWDVLWRFNATTKPTNNDNRVLIRERQKLMDYIQELANEQIKGGISNV